MSHKEAEQAVYAAIMNAYSGGQPMWAPEPDAYEMPVFGDLDELLLGKGRFYMDHDDRMLAIGNIISGGISKLVLSNDPQASDKIRRLTQIAVAAGYLFALLDDAAADKRKPKRMTQGRKKSSSVLGDKIRKFAANNPDMTQKDMAVALRVSRKTVGNHLNK